MYGMNENYFEEFKDEYAEEIEAIQPQFYKNAAAHINDILGRLSNDCKCLDIGNGGVINYDSDKIGELICADLSVSDKAVMRYADKKNIKFVAGNMLDLKEYEDDSFDAIIVQTVIHHLADRKLEQTEKNVEIGIRECMRVLKPGGRLLIVESTVVCWFEKLERVFYSLMQLAFKIIHFDTVYQYSYASLLRKVKMMDLNVEETAEVELDKYIWLLRKKVLTKITPCRACWICVRKSDK